MTVAVPVAVLLTAEFWSAAAWGNRLMTSSTRVAPSALISSAPTIATGLTLTRFVWGMCEPVTTTSATVGTGEAPDVVAVGCSAVV